MQQECGHGRHDAAQHEQQQDAQPQHSSSASTSGNPDPEDTRPAPEDLETLTRWRRSTSPEAPDAPEEYKAQVQHEQQET